MRLKDWKVGVAVLLVAAAVFIGFSWNRRDMPVTVSIIPSELSIGTERRLEPHMGLSGTAYFNLDVRGGPPSPAVPCSELIRAWLQGDFSLPSGPAPAEIEVTIEQWKKGQEVSPSVSTSGYMVSPGGDSFLSVSLKEEGDKAYRVIVARGNGSQTTHPTAPAFAHPQTFSRKLEGPMTLPMGEEVAVWCWIENEMTLTPDKRTLISPPRGTGTLASEAEAADFGLILRVKAIDLTKDAPSKPSGGS